MEELQVRRTQIRLRSRTESFAYSVSVGEVWRDTQSVPYDPTNVNLGRYVGYRVSWGQLFKASEHIPSFSDQTFLASSSYPPSQWTGPHGLCDV